MSSGADRTECNSVLRISVVPSCTRYNSTVWNLDNAQTDDRQFGCYRCNNSNVRSAR